MSEQYEIMMLEREVEALKKELEVKNRHQEFVESHDRILYLEKENAELKEKNNKLADGIVAQCEIEKELRQEIETLKTALTQAEANQEEAEIDLEVLVNLVPQEYLDEATGERASR